jgi:hypothetical protein
MFRGPDSYVVSDPGVAQGGALFYGDDDNGRAMPKEQRTKPETVCRYSGGSIFPQWIKKNTIFHDIDGVIKWVHSIFFLPLPGPGRAHTLLFFFSKGLRKGFRGQAMKRLPCSCRHGREREVRDALCAPAGNRTSKQLVRPHAIRARHERGGSDTWWGGGRAWPSRLKTRRGPTLMDAFMG